MRLGTSIVLAIGLLGCLSCSESVQRSDLDGGDEPDGASEDDGGGSHELPPYPGDPCLALELRYDGASTSSCDLVSCTCDGQPGPVIPLLHRTLGCVTELDCDVACTWPIDDLFICIQQFVECESDDDCAAGHCARAADQMRGGCTTGELTSRCAVDDDCNAELHCVVIDADGERECVSGMNDEPCNHSSQCDNGRCVQSPQRGFAGLCAGDDASR